MAKKKVTQYDRKGDAIEKRLQRVRNEVEKRLRPFIKKKVLALKKDCSSTQHSFSLNNGGVEGTRFDKLQDFLNRCSDEFQIDFHFNVENGKFQWW